MELIFPIRPGTPTPQELPGLLEGVDAVLASVEKYTEEVFSLPQSQSLKLISRWGVGYDSIDIPAATRSGVLVAYTPRLLDETVADYAFSLLCALARRVYVGHLEMTQGNWIPTWGHNIHEKTLGLIGCGRIGMAMARRGIGFGMRLIAYDPKPSPEAIRAGIEFVPLDQLLSESHFVSIHAALTPQTRGLVGADQLRRMKPNAYLINTSRGPLVDEVALGKALTEGVIAGAALDVFATEPLPKESPLRGVPNLLLTPHQASFTRETGAAVSEAAAQAIIDAFNGKRPKCLVDESVLNSPSIRTLLTLI